MLAQASCHPQPRVQAAEEGSPEPCSEWAGQPFCRLLQRVAAEHPRGPCSVLSSGSLQDSGWGQAVEPG